MVGHSSLVFVSRNLLAWRGSAWPASGEDLCVYVCACVWGGSPDLH